MTTVTRSVQFAVKGRRKRAVVATSDAAAGPLPINGGNGEAATNATVGRVPRVARLMALAIRYDQLLRDGVVANQTELARLARVTQPRMTQIMNLLHLASDIKEEILFLPEVVEGRDLVTERDMRAIAAEVDWSRQRAQWRSLKALEGVSADPELLAPEANAPLTH